MPGGNSHFRMEKQRSHFPNQQMNINTMVTGPAGIRVNPHTRYQEAQNITSVRPTETAALKSNQTNPEWWTFYAITGRLLCKNIKFMKDKSLALKETKDTWELHAMCDHKLDPGPRGKYFSFDTEDVVMRLLA